MVQPTETGEEEEEQVCVKGENKDFSLNLSLLFEIFKSNTSIYYKLSDSGIIEIHLIHNGGL